ncbi:hypothetical protein V6N13_056863 [Hibiscus sabdariffa]|uniref:Uncharacterized protein n=1 Tax=Hibiscus sabdariffa TaxID=183260 RepID=A0ABR2PIY0_9ROSI
MLNIAPASRPGGTLLAWPLGGLFHAPITFRLGTHVTHFGLGHMDDNIATLSSSAASDTAVGADPPHVSPLAAAPMTNAAVDPSTKTSQAPPITSVVGSILLDATDAPYDPMTNAEVSDMLEESLEVTDDCALLADI